MVAEYYKTKICKAVSDLVKSVHFREVKHADNGEINLIEDERIYPKVYTNETTAFFGGSNYKGIFQIEKSTWNWQVKLNFSVQVLLEEFERIFCETPPLIPADPENKTRQVRLIFKEADYMHPPEYDAATGTQVTYTFDADIMPA